MGSARRRYVMPSRQHRPDSVLCGGVPHLDLVVCADRGEATTGIEAALMVRRRRHGLADLLMGLGLSQPDAVVGPVVDGGERVVTGEKTASIRRKLVLIGRCDRCADGSARVRVPLRVSAPPLVTIRRPSARKETSSTDPVTRIFSVEDRAFRVGSSTPGSDDPEMRSAARVCWMVRMSSRALAPLSTASISATSRDAVAWRNRVAVSSRACLASNRKYTATSATTTVTATTPRRMRERFRSAAHVAGGMEFGLLALLLGLDAVVFTPPGGLQVVAGGVEAVAEAGFGGQGFGLGQAGAFQQPGFVAVAGVPVGGGALQGVGVFEVLGLVAQPRREFAPLAQQAFQRDLDHGLPVAGVFDQQPLLHHLLDQRVAGGGQVVPAGQAAHGLVVVGVDGGQPRDERIVQGVELGLALLGVGGEEFVDLGLHDLGHPAHRLVLGHRQIAVFAEIAVEPLQRQRQQRQRIGPLGGLGQQPLHQRRFDGQPPPGGAGAPGRAGDDVVVPGGRHRFEVVKQRGLAPRPARGAICSGS